MKSAQAKLSVFFDSFTEEEHAFVQSELCAGFVPKLEDFLRSLTACEIAYFRDLTLEKARVDVKEFFAGLELAAGLPELSEGGPTCDRVRLRPKEIARICHEVNRSYCQSLGDMSQPTWEDAPQWARDSALLGVELHTENPQAGPEASHESWMAQKVREGWVYGFVKNPELKQHPCMVPFAELPQAQQAKDFIFRGVVHACLEVLP